MNRIIILITVLLVIVAAKDSPREEDEAIMLGERIYREGTLPAGEALQATVQGDIPVDGRMFTCVSCHLRSGLGSREGSVITPPVNGPYLYKARPVALRGKVTDRTNNPVWKTLPPWFDGGDVRPAYTDESLMKVLRDGVDPAGRSIDPIMPRITLNDEDVALLVNYLKSLTAAISPGVTDEVISFATVVAEGVRPEDKEAMLNVLQAYLDDRNKQTRSQERRAQWGPFYHEEKNTSYRRLILNVWELTGPELAWKEQLEALHEKEPPFALLGGIHDGSWAPIHEFCEEKGVPCILPVTDRPVVSPDSWYTLYFDKGPFQEGEAAAKFLRRNEGIDSRVLLHLLREGGDGEAAIQGFDSIWKKRREKPVSIRMLQENEKLTPGILDGILEEFKPDLFFLWLGREDVEPLIRHIETSARKPSRIFLSARLAGGEDFTFIPDSLRDLTCITNPYSMPGEEKRSLIALKQWLRIRKIPEGDLSIQSRMYFLGWMLSGALKMMQDDFHRDYFLDCWDMMLDQTYAITAYPRLSFGPGQRYASKGCYIVQLEKGPDPGLRKISDWVLH